MSHQTLLCWVLLALAVGCRHAADLGGEPPVAAHSASEALAIHKARRSPRFKMIHQVAAHYRADAWVMTGYLLGRADGAFRVSAAAAVGPRLFDVSWVDGKWESEIHLPALVGRLDPKDIGRSIERIFFLECDGGGVAAGTSWIYRCPIEDPEADELELELDARTLAPMAKRFFHAGSPVAQVTFSEPKHFGDEWVPTRIRLQHQYGYGLDFSLTEYVPGFAFDDAMLHVLTKP